jgi:hypothetical protein
MVPFRKYVEEEMTGTSAVAGAGDDSDTVIVRKKYDKKKKRKDAEKVIKRFMELKKRK